MSRFEITLVLCDILPKDLAKLVMLWIDEPPAPWDPYDMWVPEYDSNGQYGMFPMTSVDLPMW